MIVAVPLDRAAAACMLGSAKSAKTDRAGRFDLSSLIRSGSPFKVEAGQGGDVAAYVLQAYGDVLWVTAAAGRASFDLVQVLDELVTVQARAAGFSAVAFRTERRGLVRKAKRQGFEITRREGEQYFLRKQIQ